MVEPLNVVLYLLIFCHFISCQSSEVEVNEYKVKEESDTIIFTAFSQLENSYQLFHSPKAINRIAQIENEYFRKYDNKGSQYYGTIWREQAESTPTEDSGVNRYDQFRKDLGFKGDSMHCTIYAVEALKSGMGESFKELEQSHRRIWNNREYAGWSIGYLLVKEWKWRAYLIIDRESEEFDHCLKSYRSKKEYPVWRQPNIPLSEMLIKGEDDLLIHELLIKNEFGWGFSHQGVHTWITRFDELKECNWLGSPSKAYEIWPTPLFLRTPFLKYNDYASHVVIFPPVNE